VSIITKLKTMKQIELASLAFYAVTGILLLAALPLASFAPHLGILGILSLIVAYSLFTKRVWTRWLIAIMFVAASVFAIFTFYSVGFSNVLVALSMLGYVFLTWIFSMYLLLKRKA
jgi:hypothetical protein